MIAGRFASVGQAMHTPFNMILEAQPQASSHERG